MNLSGDINFFVGFCISCRYVRAESASTREYLTRNNTKYKILAFKSLSSFIVNTVVVEDCMKMKSGLHGIVEDFLTLLTQTS